MSRQIGLDTLFLRPTSRIAHTEYSLPYHKSLYKTAPREIYDAWDLDFLWNTNSGPITWGAVGRATDMGHAVYTSDGADQRQSAACPFTDPEEVY